VLAASRNLARPEGLWALAEGPQCPPSDSVIGGAAWSAERRSTRLSPVPPRLQRSDMGPLRGGREGGSATLTAVLSGRSMRVATTTALSAHHVRFTEGRSAGHIGWVRSSML
jgi:hypothetical protein